MTAVWVRLADVQPESVRWLWSGRIPLGKVSVLCGDPSLGKSMVSLDLAARVSRGVPWPDRRDEPNPAGGVVIVSAEDDVSDTIRPRLDAAGADVSRIVALQGIRYTDDEGASGQRSFNLSDLPALEDAIRAVPECRLLVIDPVSAFMAGVDSHKNADVRGVLAPLAELAARFKVAVVCVTHLSKAPGRPAMYRATGSLAFVAAARAAWLFVADKGQPGRRLMLGVKNNLAAECTGLAYRIESGGGRFGAPVIAWDPAPVTTSADEALTAAEASQLRPAKRDEAMEWLRELLASGAMPSEAVKREGLAAGYSWPTVRRAKDALRIVPKRSGFGRGASWFWELPSGGAVAHEDAQPPKGEGCAPSAGAIENAVSEGPDTIDAQMPDVSTYGRVSVYDDGGADDSRVPTPDVPELLHDPETGKVVGTVGHT